MRSVIILLVLFFHSFSFAQNIPLSLSSPSLVQELSKKEGYLLLKLDVSGIAPSFKFLKLKNKGNKYLAPGEKPKGAERYRERQVELKGLSNGYYLLPLPAGLYQITEINVPFYNLPHRLDTEFERDWRFLIEAGKVNYAGNLYINSERRAKSVDVQLINRIAAEFEAINEELGLLLEKAPLSNGAGIRDDFLDVFVTRGSE